uniref:Uncharacterized protein n=1 Tax=Anguilla anguilla TaxID=7936 RepID=A0A0E9XAR5_ANGAN
MNPKMGGATVCSQSLTCKDQSKDCSPQQTSAIGSQSASHR